MAPTAAESIAGLSARVESLEDQASSLRKDDRELRDVLSGLRTDLALTRQSLEDVREEIREARTSRALPTRAALVIAGLALVTGAAGGWLGRQLPDLPRVPQAMAAQR